MLLQKLELENFQGIRKQEFIFPDGCSATIYGDNATGKTTVFNALTWILFGTASTGAKNFTPKTVGANGELHNLEHSAEATFIVDGGRLVTMKKVYHEVWKKKRGSTHKEFSGNTTDYYIDGVPTQEKEYTNTVLAHCGGDAERQKVLTMPDYFPEQMDWKKRRAILLEACGDVSEKDVIASKDELSALRTFLLMPGTESQYYTVEEYRKIAENRRREINKQIASIPARIDEVQKAMPDISGLDIKKITEEIQDSQHTIAELQAEKAMAKTGSTAAAEIQKRISQLTVDRANAKAAHINAQNERNVGTDTQLYDLHMEAEQYKRAARTAQNNLEEAQQQRTRLSQERDQLRAEWKKINAETWDPAQETCPTCGQVLPTDKITQMRSDWNKSKSERKMQINGKGKTRCGAAVFEQLDAKIKAYEIQINSAQKAQGETEARIAEIESQRTATEPFEQTEEYKAFNEQIIALKEKLSDETQCADEATAEIDRKVAAENMKLQKLQEQRTSITLARTHQSRIHELEDNEKQFSAEYDNVEHGIYLCDLFVKTKVGLLTERINKKFKRVRFLLFKNQVNGGIDPCCEVLVPAGDGRMVPYAYANNAARINAGLEIIDTLSEHWGISLPVFLDNSESVTKPYKTAGQLIKLAVSEKDKALRLVIEQ